MKKNLTFLAIALPLLAFTACITIPCLTGCGVIAPNYSALPAAATAAEKKAAVNADLLNFALTAQNVVQNVNAGAKILAPDVKAAAQAAQLVIHGSQSAAILNKIIAVSSQVSAAGVEAGLPPSVIQAQVSAVNTPAVAAAIVEQVQAAPAPTTSTQEPPRFKITAGLRPIYGWKNPYNVALAK